MNLRDRLHRIYGSSDPAPDKTELRSQLERLASGRVSSSLADYLGGRWVERPTGKLMVVDRTYEGMLPHGDFSLSEIYGVPGAVLASLSGIPDFEDFHPDETVFFDTETTGLAGGTGTCVFLIGAGYFEKSCFRIRQFFLPGFDSEEAFLECFSEWLTGSGEAPRFRFLVSFNGKSYDLNLLDSRFTLQRLRPVHRDLHHLDLLHPSRLLWKQRLGSCALQALERAVLGVHRQDDVPSALIPRIYFDYLQWGRYQLFRPVFEHNRLDLLSLVTLLSVISQSLQEPSGRLHVDPVAAARFYARRGQPQQAVTLLESVAAQDEWREGRLDLLAEMARLRRRLGDNERALALWNELIHGYPDPPLEAFEEAAKILEHDRKDYEAALGVVDEGLEIYPSDRLEHRRFRLECRLAGRKWY